MTRPLHTLEQLAIFDGRFFKGTIKDWSLEGNDAFWITGREPVFKHGNEQLTGLDFRDGNVIQSASAAIPVDAPFAFEIVLVGRKFGNGGNPGYIWALPAIYCRAWIATNGQIGFNPGALLTTAAGTAISLIPLHLVLTRDNSNNGKIFKDGVEVASGPVGDRGGTGIYIGNRGETYDRTFDGTIFLIRLFSDGIDNGEANLLYEHSRARFSPASPKRSGIYSPAGA